jgi:retron-type reverse transcriptase
LLQLKTELETKTYQPGKYKTFIIIERKPRMISAAPYRDRIIHHALCNIPHYALQVYYKGTFNGESGLQPLLLLITINSLCNMYFYLQSLELLSEKAFNSISNTLHFDVRNVSNIIIPILEKTFIYHTYANRINFGTHKALRRFTQFSRSSRYVLQCDIVKYFPSIDHQILKGIIRRKIKCQDTLWLIEKIIDGSNQQIPVLTQFPGDDLLASINRRKGLPLGNLTSQFFANLYLNNFDHFIKEELKVKKYLPYVDDFALFSDDKEFLVIARQKIETYLADLRLKIHPIKSQLFQTKKGANFVGFRVLPDRIRIGSENLRAPRKKFRQLHTHYRQGKIESSQIQKSLQSWFAHLDHGNTWHLKQKILTFLNTME